MAQAPHLAWKIGLGAQVMQELAAVILFDHEHALHARSVSRLKSLRNL